MNLYKKISNVMKEIDYLTKDDRIKYKKTDYKAISEEKVTSNVRKSLIKNGLIILPIEQEHKREGTLSTVNTKYKIVDIDTGESEVIVSSGTGADTQDKGVGKAMTYSYKYLLLRTFAIPTGEDPDKISSEELDEKQKKKEITKSKASNKQLDYVDSLLNQNVKKTNGKLTKEQLYEYLLEKMSTKTEIKDWTAAQANQAIKILQRKGE